MREADATDFHEWTYVHEFPADVAVVRGAYKRHLVIDDPVAGFVEGKFSSFNQFLVSQIDMRLDDHVTGSLRERGARIGMYFNLSGSCSFGDAGVIHAIGPGQQNTFFSSGYEEQIRIMPEEGRWDSIEINIPVSYYTNLFEGYSESQRQFIAKIHGGQSEFCQTGIRPMTMPMKWIINTLRQCTRTGALRRLFFEAKILELLMLQIEQTEFAAGQQIKVSSNNHDLEALLEAKAILERNLLDPPTIKNLSRMIGMNEFNLKRGFKNTFNTTIYGYVNGMKMQQAKQLILQREKPIQEIAVLAGYKNPQHFTVAFKKYFGQLPSMLRSITLLLINLQDLFFSEEVFLVTI